MIRKFVQREIDCLRTCELTREEAEALCAMVRSITRLSDGYNAPYESTLDDVRVVVK